MRNGRDRSTQVGRKPRRAESGLAHTFWEPADAAIEGRNFSGAMCDVQWAEQRAVSGCSPLVDEPDSGHYAGDGMGSVATAIVARRPRPNGTVTSNGGDKKPQMQ